MTTKTTKTDAEILATAAKKITLECGARAVVCPFCKERQTWGKTMDDITHKHDCEYRLAKERESVPVEG